MRGEGVQSVGQVLVEGQHDVDVGEDSGRKNPGGGNWCGRRGCRTKTG